MRRTSNRREFLKFAAAASVPLVFARNVFAAPAVDASGRVLVMLELAGGKLPVGVQIVGPQYADYRTIAVARLLEREYYAFTPPPGYD